MPRRRSYKRRRFRWSWLLWLVLLGSLGTLYLYLTTSRPVDLIDPKQQLVKAGTEGWDYRRSLHVDLDGDGSTEVVEILARVQADPLRRGDFQWDDGQPWQVYVRDGEELTYVYARYVQLGDITAFITDESPPRLVIAEKQGAGYGLYSVTYSGPQDTKTTEMVSFPVQQTSAI